MKDAFLECTSTSECDQALKTFDYAFLSPMAKFVAVFKKAIGNVVASKKAIEKERSKQKRAEAKAVMSTALKKNGKNAAAASETADLLPDFAAFRQDWALVHEMGVRDDTTKGLSAEDSGKPFLVNASQVVADISTQARCACHAAPV